ncbi:major facilitator superfamily domain-containing protein [Aspergillus avenaceus]|uniref:Major facilitator superfamily domain-containing protein n=1 Tax=Aspergillus avenaceus TaxID=36643 RepID=A0A5N6U2I4_ASPAV|nr:major facilitator superfamily domain-containing protein [Aspergillus avenaceus]
MTRDDADVHSTSLSSFDDDTNSLDERPTQHEGPGNGALEKQSTAASGLSVFEQRAQSVVSRIRSREPGQTARFTHPLSHTKTTEDAIVDFDGPDDPYRPMNWGFKKKAMTTVLYGLTTMGATWSSSIYSTGTKQIDSEFGVGEEVGTLGTALLLFGFGLGPLIWAPLSEVYGRKPAVLAPYFIAAIFSFGTATAKDLQTVMLTRFFTGFFGSAPVTNTGGVLSDIWTAEQRGAAIVGYAMAVVGGPVLGPIVGGAIVQSYLRWRWTEYITGIMMMFFLTMDLLFLDESYPPVLLVYKARRLRFNTGNWALHARHEEWDVTLKELGNKYLIRPFQLLTTPICFLVALYASFVYGILYLSLAAFPVEFQEIRGWNPVIGALPFLAYLVGILFGACINLLNQKFYIKRFKANNNFPVPEARLPPMMLGSILFAAGLFVFGWTGKPSIHWIGPIIGAVMMGFGFFTIFQAALNYLIDTFQSVSASAVAANTFLRSVFAGTFPLFASIMFRRLGVNWAASILGFVAIALIPIPYLFYVFGKRIRARGKWSRASVYGDCGN